MPERKERMNLTERIEDLESAVKELRGLLNNVALQDQKKDDDLGDRIAALEKELAELRDYVR